MSNSKLVDYTKLSPHCTKNRKHKIDTITIHHMAGNITVETCGQVFQTRQASTNYGVDGKGRVGLFVDENDRAWSTANPANDNRAVNIEVANCGGAPSFCCIMFWMAGDRFVSNGLNLFVVIPLTQPR